MQRTASDFEESVCVCEEHFSENSDYNDEDVHVPPVQENGNRN